MIIRPFTFITSLLFVLSGAFMFVIKHQSQMLDAQLSATNQATEQDEQSIRVLQAQWALEADPSRLASLAAQFTGLQPMQPGQLITLSSLRETLPAAGAPAPGANPEDPMPVLPQLASAAPLASPPAATAPARMASVTPVPAALTAPVQLAAATPAASMVVPASVIEKPRRHVPPERFASADSNLHSIRHAVRPRHDGASAIYVADAAPLPSRAVPIGAQVMRVSAVSTPAPASAVAPADDGGSLLGMAQGGSQ